MDNKIKKLQEEKDKLKESYLKNKRIVDGEEQTPATENSVEATEEQLEELQSLV